MGLICEGMANIGTAATRLCRLSKKSTNVNDVFRTVYVDLLHTQRGGPIDLPPRYNPSDFRCVAYVLFRNPIFRTVTLLNIACMRYRFMLF
jgi:hypothetical protein